MQDTIAALASAARAFRYTLALGHSPELTFDVVRCMDNYVHLAKQLPPIQNHESVSLAATIAVHLRAGDYSFLTPKALSRCSGYADWLLSLAGQVANEYATEANLEQFGLLGTTPFPVQRGGKDELFFPEQWVLIVSVGRSGAVMTYSADGDNSQFWRSFLFVVFRAPSEFATIQKFSDGRPSELCYYATHYELRAAMAALPALDEQLETLDAFIVARTAAPVTDAITVTVDLPSAKGGKYPPPPAYDPSSKDWITSADLSTRLGGKPSTATLAQYRKKPEVQATDDEGDYGYDLVGCFRRNITGQENGKGPVAYYIPQMRRSFQHKLEAIKREKTLKKEDS